MNPLLHYELFGRREGRVINDARMSLILDSGFFDVDYYIAHHPDLATDSDFNPVLHYLTTGYQHGDNPSAKFDNDAYLSIYPDIFRGGMDI